MHAIKSASLSYTEGCSLFTCSGYGIAAQALSAIIREHDGRGPYTALTSSILKTLCLSSADELIGYFLKT